MKVELSNKENFTLGAFLNALKGNNIITIFHLYGDEGSTFVFKGKVSTARKKLSDYFNELIVYIEPYLAIDNRNNINPAFICEIREIIKGEDKHES